LAKGFYRVGTEIGTEYAKTIEVMASPDSPGLYYRQIKRSIRYWSVSEVEGHLILEDSSFVDDGPLRDAFSYPKGVGRRFDKYVDVGNIRCLAPCSYCKEVAPVLHNCENVGLCHFCRRAVCSRCGIPTGNGDELWCRGACTKQAYELAMSFDIPGMYPPWMRDRVQEAQDERRSKLGTEMDLLELESGENILALLSLEEAAEEGSVESKLECPKGNDSDGDATTERRNVDSLPVTDIVQDGGLARSHTNTTADETMVGAAL
jgi:hypothetical protein